MRYSTSHDKSSPGHSKSPAASSFDGIESEASSHSKASVRLRDDAPLPYPIDGQSRRHLSPGSDRPTSSAYKKRASSPSPVTSSGSSRSRSSSSRRSRSSSGSSSPSSSRRSHNSKKSTNRRKRREKRTKGTSISSHSSSRKIAGKETVASPIKPHADIPVIPLEPQNQAGELSSGHESISSDELPYFPDEEAAPAPGGAKRKRSPNGNKSSSSTSSVSSRKKRRKRKDSAGKDSISSNDLIYSPTRLKSSAPKESKEVEKEDDEQSIERPPMSPAGSSISSGEFPEYQGPLEQTGFSPHRPVSPSELPPLPEDIDGFQPPLPDDCPPFPEDRPPLPPLPPDSEDHPVPPPEPSTDSVSHHNPHVDNVYSTCQMPDSEPEEGEISDEMENSFTILKQRKGGDHSERAWSSPQLGIHKAVLGEISDHVSSFAPKQPSGQSSPSPIETQLSGPPQSPLRATVSSPETTQENNLSEICEEPAAQERDKNEDETRTSQSAQFVTHPPPFIPTMSSQTPTESTILGSKETYPRNELKAAETVEQESQRPPDVTHLTEVVSKSQEGHSLEGEGKPNMASSGDNVEQKEVLSNDNRTNKLTSAQGVVTKSLEHQAVELLDTSGKTHINVQSSGSSEGPETVNNDSESSGMKQIDSNLLENSKKESVKDEVKSCDQTVQLASQSADMCGSQTETDKNPSQLEAEQQAISLDTQCKTDVQTSPAVSTNSNQFELEEKQAYQPETRQQTVLPDSEKSDQVCKDLQFSSSPQHDDQSKSEIQSLPASEVIERDTISDSRKRKFETDDNLSEVSINNSIHSLENESKRLKVDSTDSANAPASTSCFTDQEQEKG